MFYWIIYAGILLYMELVFHFGCFGLQGGNPVFAIGIIALVACIQALISGIQQKKWRRRVFWILTIPEYLIFAAQAVYYKIFRQPLRIGIAVNNGQDALSNYWREALVGILHTIPLLLILALPLIATGILMHRRKTWHPFPLQGIQKLRLGLGAWAALLYCVCSMAVGNMLKTNYAEEYLEFYDPDTVMRNMGVLTMIQRDGWYELQSGFNALARQGQTPSASGSQTDTGQQAKNLLKQLAESAIDNVYLAKNTLTPGSENPGEGQAAANPGDNESNPSEVHEQEPDTSPNAWSIDMERLAALSQGGKETKWLADYIAGLTPTNRNEYTGFFEGYNLIFLTAEGFSTYAVREDLTPTLYKMLHSSFVFNNYYVPLWQTSTSDGEYVNCTGLIPDGQRSMKKSAANNMAYTLPRFFATEGVYSWGYHDHNLSYYDRHLTHPNLGYDFKASKLGDTATLKKDGITEDVWDNYLFQMENPDAWPASDYDMMVGTIPEYINADRFHVYYMTVSGHVNYSFSGNRMARKNKDAVTGLDLSENGQAYIACHIEVDKALQYLLEQLELAGKLENTVICLSADHYPYGMTEEQYEELAGKDLSGAMDMYRNSLILWNAGMQEPIVVDKACCSVDLLPTLLNLFGFDYDSRMYAGRDIFSDEEGLVIFSDKSFVSDTVAYNRKQKTTTWLTDLSPEEQDAYMTAKQQDVTARYLFSAYILRNNYYDIVRQCVDSN